MLLNSLVVVWSFSINTLPLQASWGWDGGLPVKMNWAKMSAKGH